MCGIVGYVGPRAATPIILEGLQRLEYRGYDSAGLAVIEANGHVAVRRDAGKLHNLIRRVEEAPITGQIGVGHTRWATHGPPTARNAHPHRDKSGEIVVVQNGIVENFLPLRNELLAEGYEFQSDTDTEVIVQLIGREYARGGALEDAVRRALHLLHGPSAVVVLSSFEPEKLIIARLGNAGGVVVGYGEGEMFIASDIPAILEHTRLMSFLENREMVVVTEAGEELAIDPRQSSPVRAHQSRPRCTHVHSGQLVACACVIRQGSCADAVPAWMRRSRGLFCRRGRFVIAFLLGIWVM